MHPVPGLQAVTVGIGAVFDLCVSLLLHLILSPHMLAGLQQGCALTVQPLHTVGIVWVFWSVFAIVQHATGMLSVHTVQQTMPVCLFKLSLCMNRCIRTVVVLGHAGLALLPGLLGVAASVEKLLMQGSEGPQSSICS